VQRLLVTLHSTTCPQGSDVIKSSCTTSLGITGTASWGITGAAAVMGLMFHIGDACRRGLRWALDRQRRSAPDPQTMGRSPTIHGLTQTGSDSASESPGNPRRDLIPEELHCKRCGEAMTQFGTLFGNFGDEPRFKLFRCVACGFYDWVKA
jgi:hypothetical protein